MMPAEHLPCLTFFPTFVVQGENHRHTVVCDLLAASFSSGILFQSNSFCSPPWAVPNTKRKPLVISLQILVGLMMLLFAYFRDRRNNLCTTTKQRIIFDLYNFLLSEAGDSNSRCIWEQTPRIPKSQPCTERSHQLFKQLSHSKGSNVFGWEAPCSPEIRARLGAAFLVTFRQSFPPPTAHWLLCSCLCCCHLNFPPDREQDMVSLLLDHRVGGCKITKCLHCTDVSHKTNRAEVIWRGKKIWETPDAAQEKSAFYFSNRRCIKMSFWCQSTYWNK